MKHLLQSATASLLIVAGIISADPIGTGFTYQGELVQDGMNVTDQCDFNFGLWNALSGGAEVAVAVDALNVSVDEGRFTVELDFGAGAFNGDARWLEIAVRCPAGSGAFSTLAPRQQLTPTPNATYALSAGTVDWSGLSGVPPDIADGDDVDDADADPANELQDLELSVNSLSLSGDASPVDLSGYLDNTDDQNLAEILQQGGDAGGAAITNLPAPAVDSGAATKAYVDGVACSLGACSEAGRAILTCGGTSALMNCQVIGADWSAHSAAEANVWQSVTYGDGLFVAVANTGTNRVMTSPDGINWTARIDGEANVWQSVTYGGGLFVAVAGTGENRVMTSPDGIDWTARSAAEANNWRSVSYGGGQFVAVSDSGTNRVMTSPDGITWTARSVPEANLWYSVTYGAGQFVAVSADGTNRVMTSPDGITWTARSAAEANEWYSVTYGGGQFVAVSANGTNRVMTSPDGITWTARSAAEANSWYSVTYGLGHFVAVSGSGTNRVMTSTDGINWTARMAAEANLWFSVTYGGGLFVAVSPSGTNHVMISPGQ